MSELWHTFLHILAYAHLLSYAVLGIWAALTWKRDPWIVREDPPTSLTYDPRKN